KLEIADDSRGGVPGVNVTVTGRNGSYPLAFADLPLAVTIVLGDATAGQAGSCGRRSFDANQYPFQAIHAGLVTVGSPPPAKMAVAELKADPLSSSGTLRIRVKNLAGVVRQASVSVVAPEGIEVSTPTEEVKLAAWQERVVSVPIVNRTALVGSRYPVFAEVQYDDEGVHQTVAGQGM